MFEAKSKFEERFYCWSVKDWDRELNSDFNFLRAIKCMEARFVVNVLDSLEQDQLIRLTKVLAKRSVSEDVLQRCSESLTENEKQQIEDFIKLVRKESWREASKISPGEGLRNEKGQNKLKRSVLKRAVVSELSHILGDKYESCEGEEIIYTTPIGPWKLVTFVDFGGSIQNLCYHHNIVNDQGGSLIENVSILRWLGISGGTQWENLKNECCQEVADTLAKIIEHFLQAVKELIAGLPDS